MGDPTPGSLLHKAGAYSTRREPTTQGGTLNPKPSPILPVITSIRVCAHLGLTALMPAAQAGVEAEYWGPGFGPSPYLISLLGGFAAANEEVHPFLLYFALLYFPPTSVGGVCYHLTRRGQPGGRTGVTRAGGRGQPASKWPESFR